MKAPFPVKKIHWRVGSTNARKLGVKSWQATKGIALAYINARDVMQRLDNVIGPLNWQCRYSHVTDKGVVCEIGILVDGNWLWRANGAGDTQVEAEKGAMSDAFKRAAVMWGIGRYLYSLPNTWVDLDNGRIKQPPPLPDWATPEGYQKILKEMES
jgi:hypothetical protein